MKENYRKQKLILHYNLGSGLIKSIYDNSGDEDGREESVAQRSYGVAVRCNTFGQNGTFFEQNLFAESLK